MKISDSQTDENSLAAFGAEAVRLICSGDVQVLADRFGYALAFGRAPATAIREDLAACLAELHANNLVLVTKNSPATVKYFRPNDSEFFAIVECLAPADNGTELLLELIVIGNGSDKHLSFEQLSVAA
jgi:hypothetical protein